MLFIKKNNNISCFYYRRAMDTKRVIEPLFNSAGEVLPFILFIVTSFFVPLGLAFAIGLASYFLCLSTFFITKQAPSFVLGIAGIMLVMGFTVLTSSSSIYPESLSIVSEIILIIAFSIALGLRKLFIKKTKNRHTGENGAAFRIRVNDTYLATRIIRNFLTIHLLIILLYKILPDQLHSCTANKIVIPGLLLAFTVSIFIFEAIRISIMKLKFNTENWVPIVNEAGGVIGKIALSVSMASNKSYLHPVVRIVLTYKGLFYLCERPEHFSINPGKIDYPFEEYVFFNHSLDDAVNNSLQKETGRKDLPVKFAFRYLCKNKKANQLIHLYTCRIDDKDTMYKICRGKGKLWTEKQIEENLGKGVFSECFEKEYEILKNTVLMAEKLIKQD